MTATELQTRRNHWAELEAAATKAYGADDEVSGFYRRKRELCDLLAAVAS